MSLYAHTFFCRVRCRVYFDAGDYALRRRQPQLCPTGARRRLLGGRLEPDARSASYDIVGSSCIIFTGLHM